MKKNNKKYAFTLVELIVTIIILAILWTIAFFALQSYSKNSRDSVRVANLSRMKTSLDIFAVEAWKYPMPTNSVDITYSWWVIWKQWIFWEDTFTNVEKLDEIPTDPLTNSYFTYSILSNKSEFQLGWITENSWISFRVLDYSYAWNTPAKAIIIWNYNWFAAKSINWSNCNILTVPSIIASDTDISTNYEDIVNNERLVFDWYENLPSSFYKSKFKIDWGFNFVPNSLVVYSWSCNNLETNSLLRLNLLQSIKNAYSWTILYDYKNYSSIRNLNINTSSPSLSTRSLADNLTSTIIWRKIKTSFSMQDLLGSCDIGWTTVNNWDTILTFSENNISNWASYACSDVSQIKTCTNWVLDWNSNYTFTSCVKWTIDNCLANSALNVNTHLYNIPATNHTITLNDIGSQNVYENNWTYQYKLNTITCNDWVFININENTSPTLVSCNSWFVQDWNLCTSPWVVTLNWVDILSCPWCSN